MYNADKNYDCDGKATAARSVHSRAANETITERLRVSLNHPSDCQNAQNDRSRENIFSPEDDQSRKTEAPRFNSRGKRLAIPGQTGSIPRRGRYQNIEFPYPGSEPKTPFWRGLNRFSPFSSFFPDPRRVPARRGSLCPPPARTRAGAQTAIGTEAVCIPAWRATRSADPGMSVSRIDQDETSPKPVRVRVGEGNRLRHEIQRRQGRSPEVGGSPTAPGEALEARVSQLPGAPDAGVGSICRMGGSCHMPHPPGKEMDTPLCILSSPVSKPAGARRAASQTAAWVKGPVGETAVGGKPVSCPTQRGDALRAGGRPALCPP